MTEMVNKTVNDPVSDQVFDYYSTLIWHNYTMESVLTLVWKYQTRYVNYAVVCLKEILTLINEDEDIMKFFAKQAPPNYQWARFTDWFNEFLASVISGPMTEKSSE